MSQRNPLTQIPIRAARWSATHPWRAMLAWLAWESSRTGKPTAVGTATGLVVGLVAITPACAFVTPWAAAVIGVLGATASFWVVQAKHRLGADDSLDVFGVHCIGGILGALATGILVDPKLGGVGIPDYATKPGEMVLGTYDMMSQFIIQAEAVGLTLLWLGVGSAILYKLVDLTIGLRVTQDEEREGLDIADHGERAYNY